MTELKMSDGLLFRRRHVEVVTSTVDVKVKSVNRNFSFNHKQFETFVYTFTDGRKSLCRYIYDHLPSENVRGIRGTSR